MAYEELKGLSESYLPQERESLLALAQEYRIRDEQKILELAAIAADVSLDRVLSLGLEPEADPQFRDAFHLLYPNGVESLSGLSEEQVRGHVNRVKGKYFEVLVRDRLNAGERVGELEIKPDQEAILAESQTQPGWDLRILNEDGSEDEPLQLKAAGLAHIKEALEKYPGIRVVTTSDIEDVADDILRTDISNEQLTRITETQMGEIDEGAVEDVLNKGAEAAFDSIPYVSMALTGVIEGRNLLMGRSTLQESLRRGAKRMGRAAVYDAIGTALDFTTVGVAVPITVGLRAAEGRITGLVELGDHLESKTRELRQLTTPQTQAH